MGINHYIYYIFNMLNGKFYVGRRSTNNLPENDSYLGSGTHLKRAIKKYGKQNFKKEIIEQCSDFETLCKQEEFWIKELKAVEKGYNVVKTSEGYGAGELHPMFGIKGKDNPMFGRIVSEETREKLRKANTGKVHSEESKRKMSEAVKGEKNGFYKKTHTEEVKLRISETHKGNIPWNKDKKGLYKHSKETKKKLSDKCRGELHPMFGKHHTKESKKMMSEAKKGKMLGKDNPFFGKTHSKEAKEKNRQAHIGKKLSEKTIEKIKRKVTCPHCNKIGGITGMNRYHFDNCKYREILIDG